MELPLCKLLSKMLIFEKGNRDSFKAQEFIYHETVKETKIYDMI